MGKPKLTTNEFIKRAKEIHNNIYDYSKTEYINSKTKVCIICSEHGEFWLAPGHHLEGHGCPKCSTLNLSKKRVMNLEEFIEKSTKVHSNKYNYSKVEYINSKTKVCIICPEHGEFWQSPVSHYNGLGCPKCAHIKLGKEKRISLQLFIDKISLNHPEYDFSNTIFEGMDKHCQFICPKHGPLLVLAASLYYKNSGCPKCGIEKRVSHKRSTASQFIAKAKKVHGDKYDYSKIEYKNCDTPVTIVCPIHGEFQLKPYNHIHGSGCNKCAIEKNHQDAQISLELFIKVLLSYHPEYDFSITKFKGMNHSFEFICPIHGKQTGFANGFYYKGYGCKACNESHGERIIRDYLIENNLDFISLYPITINDQKLKIDFVVKINNKMYFIEYNGILHYIPVEHFGGQLKFELQLKRDKMLRKACFKYNIPLCEIHYETSKENIFKLLELFLNN